MWNSKVIWSEGMFLQPQHFQQQERYFHHQLENRTSALRPFPWGFTALQIDPRALALGEIAIGRASGVMKDGTPFCIAEEDAPPQALRIPENAKDELVMLALPMRRRELEEVDREDDPNGLARWTTEEYSVRDSNLGFGENPAPLEVAKLRFRLALDSQLEGGFEKLAVARIKERLPDNALVLDENFIPPCLCYGASTRLEAFVRELSSLLRQRGDALSKQVLGLRGGAVAEVADFLLLQIVNRYEPLIAHVAGVRGVHPEEVYRMGLTLSGELAAIARESKRPRDFSAYRHEELWATFQPLIEELRQLLAVVIDRHAIEVPIEKLKHVQVAHIPDHSLVRAASLVLAVSAEVPADQLRVRFPAQSKIGPVECIKALVAGHGSGIQLSALNVAPRQIPFHKGYVYFELDRNQQPELWQMLEIDPNMAIHVAGDFPALNLECWAIRE